MKGNSQSYRPGFSLIELLLAVTFGSMVMAIGVGMINRGMKYHSSMQERIQLSSTFNRFAEQFRRDVHEAAQADSSDTALMLTNDRGETAQYSTSDSKMVCDRMVAGVRHREVVDLASEQSASFTHQPTTDICSLEVRANIPEGKSRILRRIEAAVGLNNISGATR